MHKTNPSELGAGQAPIDPEELASIERELRFHAERYTEAMLTMWMSADPKTQAALERIYADATRQSLSEIHLKRTAKALLKKPINNAQAREH